jgi:ankyrin repeat protein
VTPLHRAVFIGNWKVVAHLASASENDINSQDANGDTPLHIASRQGNAIIVRMLLDCATLDASITNMQSLSALQVAENSRKAIVVGLLIYYDAHKNDKQNKKVRYLL